MCASTVAIANLAAYQAGEMSPAQRQRAAIEAEMRRKWPQAYAIQDGLDEMLAMCDKALSFHPLGWHVSITDTSTGAVQSFFTGLQASLPGSPE
jgi:hypothetical protein